MPAAASDPPGEATRSQITAAVDGAGWGCSVELGAGAEVVVVVVVVDVVVVVVATVLRTGRLDALARAVAVLGVRIGTRRRGRRWC